MAFAKVNDLIKCYPLNLIHMSESNYEERDFNVTVKEFLYETSKINFDSCLNNMDNIKYYLGEYFKDVDHRLDDYADVHHPSGDIMPVCEMYIQRFYEGIAIQSKKVLTYEDGQGPPTFLLEDFTPDFFLAHHKIQVKANLYILKRRKEHRRYIPTFKFFKEDVCVVCLQNKPEIMFYDCRHFCVCSDCEKVKPLMKCACCRKDIFTKIII